VRSVLAVVAVALVFAPAPAPLLALGDSSQGEALYKKAKCAMCHSADGSANTPTGKRFKARDLRSPEVQTQSDAELAAIIRNGKEKMPSFGSSFKAEEIQDLVAFIRKLASQK
jgi:mono/diheme cytochrome c family protein